MHSLRLLNQILAIVCFSILFVVVFGANADDADDSEIQKKLSSDKNAIVTFQMYANRNGCRHSV